MKDVATMIEDLKRSYEAKEIHNEWEQQFLENIIEKYEEKEKQTVSFSSKQVEKIIQLHMKHCS